MYEKRSVVGGDQTICFFHTIVVSQHYRDLIMGKMVFQITSRTIVYSIVYSGADQRKRQSSASLVLVRGIRRWPVNSPHKGPVTREMFPFDDVVMKCIPAEWRGRFGSFMTMDTHLCNNFIGCLALASMSDQLPKKVPECDYITKA